MAKQATRGSNTYRKTRDPIFQLIEKHDAALTKYLAAVKHYDQLRDRLDAKQKHIPAENRLTSRTPLFEAGAQKVEYRDFHQIAASVEFQFERLTRSIGPKTAAKVELLRRDATSELQNGFNVFLGEHETRRKAAGLVQAEDNRDKAAWAMSQLLQTLVQVEAATPEGAIVRARYIFMTCKKFGPDASAIIPWWALKMVLEQVAWVVPRN